MKIYKKLSLKLIFTAIDLLGKNSYNNVIKNYIITNSLLPEVCFEGQNQSFISIQSLITHISYSKL